MNCSDLSVFTLFAVLSGQNDSALLLNYLCSFLINSLQACTLDAIYAYIIEPNNDGEAFLLVCCAIQAN